MIRTIVATFFLCLAVLFTAWWVQIILFVIALFLVKYKVALIIPAVLSDVLYGPSSSWSFGESVATLFVLGSLLVYWFLITKTRLMTIIYGVEKK